jgi:hypothetical protein
MRGGASSSPSTTGGGYNISDSLMSRRSRRRTNNTSSSLSTNASSSYRRNEVVKDIWESIDDGSTVKSVDSEVPRISHNEVLGWKLSSHPKPHIIGYQPSQHTTMSSSLSPSVNTSTHDPAFRNETASKNAIRRMRAGVGKDLKWRGVNDHQKQLRCCDAAHITKMILKMDAIDKSTTHNNNRTSSRVSQSGGGSSSSSFVNNMRGSEPLKRDKINEDQMNTEPYLLHITSKLNLNQSPTTPASLSPSFSSANNTANYDGMSADDLARAQQYFYQSGMDSIDVDYEGEYDPEADDDAKSWDEISNEMENDLLNI